MLADVTLGGPFKGDWKECKGEKKKRMAFVRIDDVK